jgi:hypothetical protein
MLDRLPPASHCSESGQPVGACGPKYLRISMLYNTIYAGSAARISYASGAAEFAKGNIIFSANSAPFASLRYALLIYTQRHKSATSWSGLSALINYPNRILGLRPDTGTRLTLRLESPILQRSPFFAYSSGRQAPAGAKIL